MKNSSSLSRRNIVALAAVSLTTAAFHLPVQAQSRCDTLSNPKAGEINIIGNSFPALQHIAKEMESCTKGGLKVQFKMTPQIKPEV